MQYTIYNYLIFTTTKSPSRKHLPSVFVLPQPLLFPSPFPPPPPNRTTHIEKLGSFGGWNSTYIAGKAGHKSWWKKRSN